MTIVHRLKRDFPVARFVLNGGLATLDEAMQRSDGLDGVMLGRAAYHDPYLLARVDSAVFGDAGPVPSRADIVMQMSRYLERECSAGTAARHVVRHMLGLYQGMRGARRWRRRLSDAAQLESAGAGILALALQDVEPPLRAAA